MAMQRLAARHPTAVARIQKVVLVKPTSVTVRLKCGAVLTANAKPGSGTNTLAGELLDTIEKHRKQYRGCASRRACRSGTG